MSWMSLLRRLHYDVPLSLLDLFEPSVITFVLILSHLVEMGPGPDTLSQVRRPRLLDTSFLCLA